MTRFHKTDVELHSDGYRTANPAINVKVRRGFGPDVAVIVERFHCDHETAEKALGFAWDMAQEAFWEDAAGEVAEIFPNAHMESEGRSSGWLTVHGLPDVESWNAIAVMRWARLVKWCRVEIAWLCSAEKVFEDIAANEWAKPGAELYNFVDTKDGKTQCIIMKMLEHTPGPWRYEPKSGTLRSEPENYWLATMDSWDGMVKPHNEANGRLIAAAPELLEALQSIEANLTGRDCFPERVADSLRRCKEAIAKATGV